MTQLNYHHLHYFWAVAHEGNLTRAAEKLHVSQSSVSVQIHKLEASLGHELFERRGRQLILTEAGRIALDHADAIFSLGQDLLGTLQEQGQDRTILRVGSQATLSRNFQLRFFAPLFDREDVEIVVQSGNFADLMRNLEAHNLDVLLANWAPPRDAATRWIAHTLAHQPISLIGPPSDHDPGAPLAELLTAEPLVLPARQSSMRIGFDALVDRMDIRPPIAAEVDDMAMLRLLAREGIGRAVIPAIVVRDELASGELVELARLPGLRETFYAITLKRRFPNPLLKDMLRAHPLEDELEDELQGAIEDGTTDTRRN
jgi:LysR family transcriptional activator of nhaA